MNILQKLGLKLLGAAALATIKGDVVELTRKATKIENESFPISSVVGTNRLEDWLQGQLETKFRGSQVQAALLRTLVDGDRDKSYAIIEAARVAEESGEGFMKKKAAVLKVIREVAPGMKRSAEQLAIELAVQLIKG
ncbi:hypothetical protein D3C87_1249310 [compost metagenome]